MLTADPNFRPAASDLLNDPFLKLDKPLEELPLLTYKGAST